MRRARALANLAEKEQLDLIASGLPILMQSAEDLLEASISLSARPRSAAILKRHAEEEIAKILILVDLVRCPSGQRSSCIGGMIRWFYDHLARLIYVDAQSWKPVNVTQLQEYVDSRRPSHYLEGDIGEYIFPNFEIFLRESDMYADIVGQEDGALDWNNPLDRHAGREADDHYPWELQGPTSWQVCIALRDFGAFSRTGLDLISKIWSQLDFHDKEDWADAKNLSYEMLRAFETTGLISESASQVQAAALYNDWQMPMYRMDFSSIEVSLEELQEERDRNLESEWYS